MTARLIDISHHQDWPHVNLLATLDGIILRCAYGSGTPDTKFLAFAKSSDARQLPWAAYHFIKPGSGVQQAEFAMRRLDAAGGARVLFMDREYEYGVIASEGTAHDYINRVDKAGLVTGTYSQLSLYQSFGAKVDWPAVWSRLVDPYQPPVYHRGDFLQIAGDNTPPGNHIDRDLFNGSAAELRALFVAGTVVGDHTPPIVPVPVSQQPGKGDAMFNLIPGTAKRTVFLKPDAILYDRSVGGTRFSKAQADDEFPWIGGANADRIVIADGDYAVFADRSDIVRQTTNAKDYGK